MHLVALSAIGQDAVWRVTIRLAVGGALVSSEQTPRPCRADLTSRSSVELAVHLQALRVLAERGEAPCIGLDRSFEAV